MQYGYAVTASCVCVFNEAGIEHAKVAIYNMKVSDVVPRTFNSYITSLYVPTNWL